MDRPISAPKIIPSRGPVIRKPNYLPHSWTHPTYTIPNRIHIRSAVLPQCTGQTQTNRWLEGICDDYSPHSLHGLKSKRFVVVLYNIKITE